MALMPLNQINCPIDITDFPQYTGFEQYQQIVAIQVPLVYDQVIQKKCLMDLNDPRLKIQPPICPPNQSTVPGLNGVIPNIPVNTPLNFREFRNFEASITNVSATQISPTQKLVTVTYNIEFIADILQGNTNVSIPVTLSGLTESVTLNCPESQSQISVSTGGSNSTSESKPIFKLEILPDLTNSSAYFSTTPSSNPQEVNVTVYFTLCYTLITKCELNVQMLVPFYGFFENGRSSTSDTTQICPCNQCMSSTNTSDLYPPINFSIFNCVSSAGSSTPPSSTPPSSTPPNTGTPGGTPTPAPTNSTSEIIPVR